MSLEYQSKLNRLLVIGKKNGLFFSEWLRKNGYSDQLIRRYRQSGWLATLDKGVMYRTGDIHYLHLLHCLVTMNS